MFLPRLSPIPSLIFSGSVFVASSLPDSSLLLFSQSGVPRSFPVLAASFPALPCFFPAPPLCFHGPSPFLPGPSPILLVPFLFSPVWRPRRPPAASLLPCFAQLLPHCSSVFPHCSACPLCLSLLLTWSLPVLLMGLQLSFPSLAGFPPWPFPDSAASFPVLSCLAASAASGRLGLSLFSPASSLLPHCSFMFPHCSACPLYFSLLLTWSLPVPPMVLQWSFPSLAGSLPVCPCFFPALYCHFSVLLCFIAIALLPCSFQVLLTPFLVKSC